MSDTTKKRQRRGMTPLQRQSWKDLCESVASVIDMRPTFEVESLSITWGVPPSETVRRLEGIAQFDLVEQVRGVWRLTSLGIARAKEMISLSVRKRDEAEQRREWERTVARRRSQAEPVVVEIVRGLDDEQLIEFLDMVSVGYELHEIPQRWQQRNGE